MEIPGLGPMTRDRELGWWVSQPISVAVLDGLPCQFALDGYEDDESPNDFHTAIANFLALTPDTLHAAEPHLFAYYQDMMAEDGDDGWDDDFDDDEDKEFAPLQRPSEVWKQIDFGDEQQAVVKRRGYGDKKVYVSVTCGCDWEEEHGLEIVFKDGLAVTKVGPYDGHLSYADSYDRPELENVVYVSLNGDWSDDEE